MLYGWKRGGQKRCEGKRKEDKTVGSCEGPGQKERSSEQQLRGPQSESNISRQQWKCREMLSPGGKELFNGNKAVKMGKRLISYRKSSRSK